MKKIEFAGLVLAFLVSAGCSSSETNGEKAIKVQTAVVKAAEEHRIIEFPGKVKASDQVDMAFKVSGTLKKYHVKEGDYVKEGTLLVELDPKDYQLQYDATLAEYNNVKAQAERVIALYKDSATTAENYDKVRYGLEQIAAKFENAKNQLDYTRIYAPYDCFVQNRLSDVSSVVGAGMPVISVISSALPEIEIYIPGSEYINRGSFSSFEARFDFWEYRYPLRLLSISPEANANQLYKMRLGFRAGQDKYPSPGMNTMVQIKSQERDSLYTEIPATALFSEEGKSVVWIVGGDKRISKRFVSVDSLGLDGNAIISDGLAVGEIVVTAGVSKLHDNQIVEDMGVVTETNVGGLL